MLPVEEQVAILRTAGVDRAILFPTVVHPEKSRDRTEFRNEMERLNRILRGEVNPLQARIDSMKELVSALEAHGGMFTGFGSVPAGLDMDATGLWVDEHIAGNGLRGMGEIALGAGQASGAENIFRVSADHGGRYPLWIHTFNPLALDDIRTLASYAEKNPSVKIIFGHGGVRHISLILGYAPEIRGGGISGAGALQLRHALRRSVSFDPDGGTHGEGCGSP
jgi:predicted TIM-barrel fold metal-dependent hydrolase